MALDFDAVALEDSRYSDFAKFVRELAVQFSSCSLAVGATVEEKKPAPVAPAPVAPVAPTPPAPVEPKPTPEAAKPKPKDKKEDGCCTLL